MNEDFIFRLGADVSSFTKSITEVEAELKSARAAVKGALGDDLIQANKYVEDLEQSLKNLKSVGVQVPGAKAAATELGKLPPAAQKAQNTLTGLSGVVRDLPFGFVAIQNNLPILADSFGNLTKTSGGFKAGLKDLGAALAGPAGVSFAIGAVISGITVLVQKYGSLSAAITEVLNLSKSQKDLNVALETATAKNIGSAESEITVLRTLTGVLTNNQLSLDARNGAYDELNKKYPGLLTNLDQEKLKNGELNTELAKRLELITTQIKLNGQRAALEKLIAEEAEKSFKTIAQFKNQTFLDALTSEFTGVLKGFNAGTAGLQDLSQSLSNGAKSTEFYNQRLKEIQTELSGVDGQILAIVEAGKKKQKADEEAARAAEKRKNELLKEAEALKKKAIAETEAFEASTKASNQRIAAAKAEQLQQQAAKNTTEALKQQKIAADQAAIALQNLQLAQMNEDALSIADPLAKLKELTPQLLKEANLTAATTLFKDTFFNPVQDLFSDLLSGSKEAMQQFSKTIANTIKQLVAKVIATGIIQLLITLASGGFGAAAGGFAGGIKTVLKGIGKSLGFAGVANPNFGGITSGGMQMSGAVNVVLRGQDLVGALNRTNAQINRVG
jgi:hypothetical protein